MQVQWARDHGSQAGGLAGWRAGGRTGANVPRPKRHGVPVQRAPHAQTPSRRPGCCHHHREPTRHGRAVRAPHHFFTTKRGPSLLSFSTSISSSSAIPPRWKLPRCETPASGALRVGSGSRSFCARTAALREVCRDGTRPRARGSGSTRAVQTSGSTRSIYTSAMCGSGHDTGHSLHPPHPGAACSLSWGRPRWAQPWAQPTRVCVARAFRAPPPTRNA